MPDNYIDPRDEDKKPKLPDPKYKIGDVVVTQKSVSILENGKRKGSALVGWQWVIKKQFRDPHNNRVFYEVSDKSGMYHQELWESEIWKLFDKLSEEQKATARAGKEVRIM